MADTRLDRASIGGRANWAGAAFELRLGVQFCVYILLNGDAGLAPGAVRWVQLQAPEAVDDLVLEFETGARWAIQAKAGGSVRVGWNRNRPFGKALRQLYDGATGGQIDLAPGSLDQVELAVDHQAHASMTPFGEWVRKARQHHEWRSFAAVCTGKEREWASALPDFLGAEADEELLAFLKRLYVRRAPAPDEWRSNLRGQLRGTGVPDVGTADRILDVLLARVAEVAPDAGRLYYEDLHRACEGIAGLPRPGALAFRLFHNPSEDELYQVLQMPPTRLARFVPRPELDGALDSDRGVLVAGRPGSGKSHGLIKLALGRPAWPVVVVARHFQADDLSRLAAALRRVHGPYQLLWDDVHEKPGLFADVVQRLAERGDKVRVLGAYREQHRGAVRKRVTPELCRRANIDPEPVRLRPFDAEQAAQMTEAVSEALGLRLDGAALAALAGHIRWGDGGPLFALAAGKLLQEEERAGGTVRAADVARLPGELVETWRHLYERLAERPNGFTMQNLLGVLRFLRQIGCPLQARLAELLHSLVLGHSAGEFNGAARALGRDGWLRREGETFAAHDVTLAAVVEDEEAVRRFSRFAHQAAPGEDLAVGLLRGSLSTFHAERIPYTRTAGERQKAVTEAAELGERAVADFRTTGHTTYLAMSLNNAANRYSALAGLEESREGRGERLAQAVAAIEESVRIRRDLGLQADLAMSLGTATVTYRAMAENAGDPQEKVIWLRRALESIEEAVGRFRAAGIVRYAIFALADDVRCHLTLANCTGELARDRVLTLCVEGERLAGPMGDEQSLVFFRQVRGQLEGPGERPG